MLDEHAQGMFVQTLNKILLVIEYLGDNLGREHFYAVASVLGTIGFIVAVGYLLAYLVRIEEEDIQKKQNASMNNNRNGMLNSMELLLSKWCSESINFERITGTTKPVPYVPELKLHELRAEKYNGLVRLLKPGCRTIILVTDMQSRPKLIPGFHKAVWPYRKSDISTFQVDLVLLTHFAPFQE